MELTWRGHLEQVIHMFGYIKKYHNDDMVVDLSEPSVDRKYFKHEYWYSSIYGDIKE